MFDDLMDKPFESLGRGPDSYDCYGLAIEVSMRLGKHLPDFGSVVSDRIRAINKKIKNEKHKFKKIKKPEIGDIVLMSPFTKTESHLGIMINKSEFIQTTVDTGVYITRIDHPFEKDLIAGFYRYEQN